MENPFCCPMANCSMSFDDEEELNAHKKKHELSLSLTPSTYNNPFLFDQTPTPTQFLSPTSLELQDFTRENPFDATFRRANSTNHASSSLLMPDSSSLIANLPDSEVLNTPSITLPSEPATPICLKPNFPKKLARKNPENLSGSENADSLPFTPNEQAGRQSLTPQENTSDADLPSESANLSSLTNSNFALLPEKVGKSQASKPVLQTSVITSVGNTPILKSSAVGVPTAVVVTRPPINSIATMSTSQVVSQQVNQVKVQKTIPAVVQPLVVGTTVLQLNISLPDGHIVHVPVVTNTQPTNAATLAPQVSSTTTSNAKMKLKEVLTQNQRTGPAVKKSTSSSKGKSKSSVNVYRECSTSSLDIEPMSPPVEPISPPVSPIPNLRPGHNGRKRRDLFDDPDEKRKRSLERNRAAATRCREKRKMWITSLERKADELAHTKIQLEVAKIQLAHTIRLENEVAQLRNEVAHLKTLLLAHKDCPVTLQQKACGHEDERQECTTVCIITPLSDDIQRVPNSSVVSPSSSDFMEMDVSSVQSNSDSSITSDMSEASYRER